MGYWKWRSPNEVTHLLTSEGYCVTCGKYHDVHLDHDGLYMWDKGDSRTYLDPVGTARPYPNAYTEVLIAGMGRTRDEIKDAIADLLTFADVSSTPTARRLAERLHRTVGSITDDLRSF